ncbi:hypothetical protein H5410_056415 [Solanum commersonii]|uniref:DUF4283 domain-containing protein n=1 Tax=Solanum commersonii TaxID=4109 RepID=A0A9J5WK69_SOLCO|nr:hypothetical protein H5410_056415 [Solanum commersonii]
MGDGRRQWSRLKLQWLSPTIGTFPITHEFEWLWIRVLGFPLHLWSRPIMKEIGDRCGGWIETEEETDLKNHLRWARIRVKGPTKKFPTSIEITDEENIFSLPIWVELPVTFRKKYDEGACTIDQKHFREPTRKQPRSTKAAQKTQNKKFLDAVKSIRRNSKLLEQNYVVQGYRNGSTDRVHEGKAQRTAM